MNDRLKLQANATIPTLWGKFTMYAFSNSEKELMPHIAFVSESMDSASTVLVRVHSECITGDLFGSSRCDCGEQFQKSMDLIAEHHGMLIYLRQEGRGIGLINKLKAYNLQDLGMNTIDANLHLGLEADARQYGVAIEILQELNVTSIKLLTNNPEKVNAFKHSSIIVEERVPLIITPQKENVEYLKTKREEMGHFL